MRAELYFTALDKDGTVTLMRTVDLPFTPAEGMVFRFAPAFYWVSLVSHCEYLLDTGIWRLGFWEDCDKLGDKESVIDTLERLGWQRCQHLEVGCGEREGLVSD